MIYSNSAYSLVIIKFIDNILTYIKNDNNMCIAREVPLVLELVIFFQIVSGILASLLMNEKIIYMRKSHVTFIEIYCFFWFTLIDSHRIQNI